jgi:hypothetical protein
MEIMSYAWDMFCPQCSAALVGGMGETDEQMEAEQKSYEGKLIYCDSCNLYTDFITGDEADPKGYKPEDIIHGG